MFNKEILQHRQLRINVEIYFYSSVSQKNAVDHDCSTRNIPQSIGRPGVLRLGRLGLHRPQAARRPQTSSRRPRVPGPASLRPRFLHRRLVRPHPLLLVALCDPRWCVNLMQMGDAHIPSDAMTMASWAMAVSRVVLIL